ncbi:hypothetical protein GPDM_00930 [Planococcus donghaensis MPA1U2]|uniref:ParB/Sulfiredoxin domain-containing protein n=1 Tax=Planococcus donghaensis MPA1U2 TaxID=933115 RepID=E7RCM2_9BACL|nr:hypothetical protein [Planococcus donghaensis]EGA91387.1 hypothetical protein GPDM_00930 [Planococcus donghaensis MPA1U2]
METNLIELIEKDITLTDGTRNLTVKGETKNHKVYKIPLEYLFYNNQNGRITTWISKYNSENNLLNLDDMEYYNSVLHGFIKQANENAFDKTKINIKMFGQKVAGVVLKNGRIIDGNRRFTCLREIAAEGEDCYFNAVILDTDEGISDKDIKRLELNLQHAEERPVDYDPIDNLVDIYRDLEQNKTFTISEYVRNVNKKKTEVEKTLKKAILMVEFLEFINADGKYYIARELNLDGPLQEMVGILNKVEEGKEEDVKSALFTALLTSQTGDLTRRIREIGNEIIKTKNADKFIEEYEEIVEEVFEDLQGEEEVDLSTVNEKVSKNTSLKEKGNTIITKKIDQNRHEAVRNKPIVLLNNALDALNAIDETVVSRMNEENKEEFEEVLKKIYETLNAYSEEINV